VVDAAHTTQRQRQTRGYPGPQLLLQPLDKWQDVHRAERDGRRSRQITSEAAAAHRSIVRTDDSPLKRQRVEELADIGRLQRSGGAITTDPRRRKLEGTDGTQPTDSY
jgi:hypothetical protein